MNSNTNKKYNIAYEIWRLIYPIIVYFAINTILLIGFMVKFFSDISNAFTLDDYMNPTILTEQLSIFTSEYGLISTIVSSIITLFVFIPLFIFDDRKSKKMGEYVKYNLPRAIKWVLVVILAFSSCLSLNLIISISGITQYSEGFEAVSDLIYNSSFLTQFIATVIAAPITEEFLVRGLIYKRMRRWAPALASAIISAALFGVIHGNLVQFVYAFIIGMILALIYEKTKTIWIPILFHLVANFVSILISNIEFINEAFNSEIVTYITVGITTISMVIIVVYFIRSKTVAGTRMEGTLETTLNTQMEIQRKEMEYNNHSN